MFQNITDEIDQDIQTSEYTQKKHIFKEMFSIQNIIFYIITLAASTIGFGQAIFPFGIALFAASCSNQIPAIIPFILGAVGSFIGFGAIGFVTYLIIALILVALVMFRKPKIVDEQRNEKQKLGKFLLFSCFIVQTVKLIIGNFLVYNLLEAIAFSVAAYIFYKIFANSIIVIKEFGIKKAFTAEELLGASLLIAIAVTSINQIAIFNFSVTNIICILLVLILGWKNGVLIGAASGVTIGVVTGIIANSEPALLATYALSGLIAGILNRFGKIGVILGFALGNILLIYVANGNTQIIIHLKELLIASLGLLLVPKSLDITVEDLIGKTKLLPVATQRTLNQSKETVKKLNSVSETISEMAKTYNEAAATVVEETKESIKDEHKESFLDELVNQLQDNSDNILYEPLQEEEIQDEIFNLLQQKEQITKQDLVDILSLHNSYIVGIDTNIMIIEQVEEIVKKINHVYRINNLNFIWKKKVNQSRKAISEELEGVSKAISSIAEDLIKQNKGEFDDKIEQITELLKQKEIELNSLEIKQDKNKKIIINLTLLSEHNTAQNIQKIESILSKVLKQEIIMQKTEKQTKELSKQIYTTKDKYKLQIGIAKTKKNKSAVTGDSFLNIQLDDGKHLLAISDGMGSGPNARKCSQVAVKMLERLLKSGFDKDTSLKLINSSMTLNSEEEMYATLDISIIDLYTGNIEFIKNGACPTYIKNGQTAEILKAISLPAGMLSNIDLVVYDRDLLQEDMILMCSDGVIDSKKDYKDKEKWVKEILEQINTKDSQKIADLVLAEAIDNGCGIIKDDMTVIVAKVIKNE